MLKYTLLAATALLLSACCGYGYDNARDPGYVCMGADCARGCPDGIKGDDCRKQHALQERDYRDDRYYHDDRYRYYNYND